MQGADDKLAIHFKGIDCEDGTLSTGYLESVVRFSKALKAISKDLYIHKTGLKRAPPHFKGIDFNLGAVEVGSTVVNLRPVNFGPSDIETANNTFDIVAKHLSGVGIDMTEYGCRDDYDPTAVIESNCKGLWTDLEENVSLEFDSRGKRYSYDRKARGGITDKTVSKTELCIIGSVYEIDCRNKRYKVQYLDDHGKEKTTSFPFGETEEDIIMEAMRCRHDRKVRITVKGVPDDVSKGPGPVQFELLDPMDMTGRLEAILGSVSKTIGDEVQLEEYVKNIRHLERILAENYGGSEPPYIYPTPDNNLEFEWESNDNVLVLTLGTMVAELIDDSDEGSTLDLNDAESWTRIVG